MINYTELVQFAEWMAKNGTARPYVWVNKRDDANEEEERLDFDGAIYPEDIDRFNRDGKRS